MDPEFARQYYESATVDHWWFRGRRELVSRLLRDLGPSIGTFVDLGAGSESLFPSGVKVVKLDVVKPDAVPGLFVQASAMELPFSDGFFDGVGIFDVLEHLDDPIACLSEVRRVVRPGGLVVVTVPAYQCLWSPHDDLVGHVRRYTPDSLQRLLADGNLRILWASAFYGFLIPPAVVRTVFSLNSSMALPPSPVNRFLARLATRSIRRSLHRPTRFGLSLAAVAVVS